VSTLAFSVPLVSGFMPPTTLKAGSIAFSIHNSTAMTAPCPRLAISPQRSAFGQFTEIKREMIAATQPERWPERIFHFSILPLHLRKSGILDRGKGHFALVNETWPTVPMNVGPPESGFLLSFYGAAETVVSLASGLFGDATVLSGDAGTLI